MQAMIQEQAIQLVLNETNRQNEKFGTQNHGLTTWTAILAEEVISFSKAVLNNKSGGNDADNVLNEAVQCAAVALAIIESLMLNENKHEEHKQSNKSDEQAIKELK